MGRRADLSSLMISQVLKYLATDATFYVLGAGASYGLVPTTAELREGVKRRYWDAGSFPGLPAPKNDMFARVVGSVREPAGTRGDGGVDDPYSPANLAEAVLGHMPLAILDTLVRMELAVPIKTVAPPQYEVLNAARPGTLFTFNLDGLAPAYCGGRHIVLEPHGRVERELFGSREFIEVWSEMMAYDVGAPNWTPKILLRPEPDNILHDEAYRHAESRIANAPALAVIGYSFSRFGDGHDDQTSLEYICDLLSRYPKPVLVIDPTPDLVADLIGAGCGRNVVVPIPAKWDLLSASIMIAIGESGYTRIHHPSASADRVLSVYQQLD